jgi:predicted ribosome quality control (RQC) complex YloA/Tae2 family protein
LPKEAKSASHGVDILFSKAKKLKQKAKNQYIQRENLKEKIEFIEKMMSIIKSAKSSEDIELLMPKQPKQQKRRQKRDTNIENFYFLGYKISLGKNEKGNIELLKSAKRSDIWLHLKDMPSTHVIIRTNKNKIDDEVLSFAAKLCVDFSIKERGEYRVDYTKRGDVKIKDGANVNYVNHKSITIVKE